MFSQPTLSFLSETRFGDSSLCSEVRGVICCSGWEQSTFAVLVCRFVEMTVQDPALIQFKI